MRRKTSQQKFPPQRKLKNMLKKHSMYGRVYMCMLYLPTFFPPKLPSFEGKATET